MASYLKTIIIALITSSFAICLIFFPKQALDATMQGISIWSGVVFPSLLPFFIISQLMIGFGVVQFLGVLFEPIMRPLFRVPGAGGFVWILGMASGYPAGAKMTAQLREKKIVSQIEAERLISFTNASSPLFIFGAIAIGFFNNPSLGILIAITHYVSNGLVGICMRFHGKDNQIKHKKKQKQSPIIVRAFKQMHQTRLEETRPLGLILSDAVISSINTLIMIGGFIILFSVLTEVLQLFHITLLFAYLIQPLFLLFSLPIEMTSPFIVSLFEITLGIKAITSFESVSLLTQLILISFILGLNGFSIQAQVASVISHTDIRFYPYFFARLLHGFIASILTILLFKPIYLNNKIFVFSSDSTQTKAISFNMYTFLLKYGPTITVISLLLTAFIIIKRKHVIFK